MTIVLTVLLAVLRFVGWLLFFLLALLIVLLLLPVELRFAYQLGHPSLTVWYGPLHFRLWPHSSGESSSSQSLDTQPQPSTPQPAAGQPQIPPSSEMPEKQSATSASEATSDTVASEQSSATSNPTGATASTAPTPASSAETAESAGKQETAGGLPFHISERIDAAKNLLTHDPTAFAHCMFGHLRWVGRFLAHHVKVQHLSIFWTVTGADAAQTAALYGAEMTAANNLLAFLQQVICLQCDCLQLEPDFTGQRRGERQISGRLHTHPFLLLWLLIRLLFRLGKDPQLQPSHTN